MSYEQAKFKVACPKCGFVRKVNAYVDAGGKPQEWNDPTRRLCGMCDLFDRAAKHQRQARALYDRAVAMRIKRADTAARRKAAAA